MSAVLLLNWYDIKYTTPYEIIKECSAYEKRYNTVNKRFGF